MKRGRLCCIAAVAEGNGRNPCWDSARGALEQKSLQAVLAERRERWRPDVWRDDAPRGSAHSADQLARGDVGCGTEGSKAAASAWV